ncbi:MAG: putative metalloprotease [Flammeovirgaceae bacterium]|jgi:predicted metalloprotease
MKWKGRRQSSNVEDNRGGGSSGGSVRRGGKKMGIGGVIIFMILGYVFRDSPMIQQFLGAAQQNMTQETSVVDTPKNARADDELAAFVKVVLADTEDVWTKLFREQMGKNYQKPVLVLYEGKVNSACGFASSATGPFYCPGDQKLYIDLSFYSDLKNKFGAPGDFAMAYVVAHEVAHHVQYLLGITRQVDSQRGKVSKTVYNDLSVRLELQADFFSGVWANHAQKMNDILEEGDIEEALNAARAIGDDRLQMQSRGYVVPESFTHGTSEQRMRWFTKGFKTGDPNQGDTFQTKNL